MTEAERVMKWCQAGTWNSNEANNLHAECYRVIGKLLKTIEEMESQEPVAWMHPSGEGYDSAFRDHSTVMVCTGNKWDGWMPLYTHPKHTKVVFPTMLRKMWSGSEVQAWLDVNVNKGKS